MKDREVLAVIESLNARSVPLEELASAVQTEPFIHVLSDSVRYGLTRKSADKIPAFSYIPGKTERMVLNTSLDNLFYSHSLTILLNGNYTSVYSDGTRFTEAIEKPHAGGVRRVVTHAWVRVVPPEFDSYIRSLIPSKPE